MHLARESDEEIESHQLISRIFIIHISKPHNDTQHNIISHHIYRFASNSDDDSVNACPVYILNAAT